MKTLRSALALVLCLAGAALGDSFFGGGGGGSAAAITNDSTTCTGSASGSVLFMNGTKINCADASFKWFNPPSVPELDIGSVAAGTGTLGLVGGTSGEVFIMPQAAAGTYNFNLPITAGTSGQPLLSGGGVFTPMTFGTLGLGGGGTNATSFTAARCVRVNAGGTALEAAGADCGSGAGNVTAGALTTGVIPKATGATAIGDGALVDNATSVVSIATAGRGSQLANASVTGTTANKLAKQSATGALIVATTDTGGVLGVCDTGCGTTGSASIIDSGPASCVFDNAVTKGDLFSLSTSVAGDCTDIGTSVTGGVPILGTVTNANAAAGTRTIWFNGPDVANITNIKGGGGGGGTSVGAAGVAQVAAAGGKFAAYGGSGTCAAGQAITSLDGSLAKTCAAFGSGSGTVTSVAATVPGGFSISGSPVTTTGTLAISANGTSGGILGYTGTTTLASSALLASNGILVGGGAGATPRTDTSLLWDVTNKRISLINLTSDGSTSLGSDVNMFYASGTMPASPSTTVVGPTFDITGAGSASQASYATDVLYRAGYTGSSQNAALTVTNQNAGTGSTLGLGTAVTDVVANIGARLVAGSSTGGTVFIGGMGYVNAGNTGSIIGLYGKADGTGTATDIGVLGTAAGSAQGTNPKNIAVYGTLNTSLVASLNGSFAGLFDGGTLPDANSKAMYTIATLPSSPSANTQAVATIITSAGSASFVQQAGYTNLNAGYTGSSATYAYSVANAVAGTANTINLATTSPGNGPLGNIGFQGIANGSSSGLNVGIVGNGSNATSGSGPVIGGWFGSTSSNGTPAQPHIGAIATAASSTEGTNLKNVALIATLHTAIPTGSNTSVAFLADGAGSDEIRGYNAGTQNFSVASTGAIATSSTITSSATGALGWSIVAAANQACNTTCTSACVMGTDAVTGGFLACTDATADSCLCAGSS